MSPESNRGPVSPGEAAELQTQQIPEEVFETFNQLIAQNLLNGRSKVLQKDVMAELEAQGLQRVNIFERHWLDVEESYRAVGWKVQYDKPMGYAGESFDAYFEFTSPKNK